MSDDTHRTPRLPPLDRFSGLRQLGARLIRAAMRGDMSIDDAVRLMHMVRVQAELIQGEMLEKRLDTIEAEATNSKTIGFKPRWQELNELKQKAA